MPDGSASGIIVEPRVLARTFEIERAVVRLAIERIDAALPACVRRLRALADRGASRHGWGACIAELRIDCGPGYRVYFKKQDRSIVVLLAGGDKRTQSRDIATALRLARNL